ncbi:MAG: DUF922 domain-containing protein [Moritella sp.]|uniref:DUF922 domain-containing Zn-dependent protease n=1 Tax=Moritella sp. TaxID=78556 RepID=UPI0025F30241|nr:DUF922 domain-containing protein [Moritella sp.]NQZ90962.1 DUF922 domain-containing protein [Moritella sp.]
MKLLLLFMFGALSIIPSLVLAKNSVSESYEFYSVYPHSKSEILSSLNNKTTISKDGEKFHGYAYSDVKWNYRWKYNKKSCWITSANTVLNTTYTLPKLGTNIDDVNEIWNQWYPNLVYHEKGHHKFATKIARKIQHAIVNMPSESTCSKLDKKANAIGHAYMSELGDLNSEYDKQTIHGETQGASLFSYL